MSDLNGLRIGDVVKLQSGGPKMTIESSTGSSVQCVWFHVSGWYYPKGDEDTPMYDDARRALFPIEALQKAV